MGRFLANLGAACCVLIYVPGIIWYFIWDILWTVGIRL